MNDLTGQVFSHYRILELVGQGGMGVVYRAQDLTLDRVVAIKFLPHHLAANEAEKARFLQEAKAASALNHPNVCTIHEIAEENDEQFIVMEYIEGRSLKDALPLQKPQDALTYALQIGDALHEAHGKGIVHRDIKCENIMVNTRNQIKVMDFGLAKLKGSLKITRTSSTLGTLAYMAPEQIQGGEIDARSDIFSFGVVLFEMLTGKLPFRGEHEASMMYSILNEEPESVCRSRDDVSADIDRIIHRALEKDPEDRYQSAADMVSELRREQKKTARVVRPQDAEAALPPPPAAGKSVRVPAAGSKRGVILWGVLGAGLLAVALFAYLFTRTRPAIDSLAVLPFENVGADPNTEYLSDGITESLINTLSQLSNLTVMSRSSVFHFKGKGVDPQEAGRTLGVKAVLAGRVTQRGENVQISTELVDVSNNSHIWGEQYNKRLSDILVVQEEISRTISRQLSVKLAGGDEQGLARVSTRNPEAYQLYLKGRFYWNKRTSDDLQRAVRYFEQAIEKDPGYAMAYAGMASTYVILPEYSGLPAKDFVPKAEAAAGKALERDASLAESHAVLGLIRYQYRWDWEGAEKEFQKAIELNPNYPTVHHWYSICLSQQGKENALPEARHALELDPLSLVINWNTGEQLSYTRQFELAAEQFKKGIELDPNFAGTYQGLGFMYALQGKFPEAVREFEKARQIVGPDNPFGSGTLGYLYARVGRKDEAIQVLNQLRGFSQRGYELSVDLAKVYAGLGEKEKALEWLETGYRERNSRIGFLKIDPEWEGLRSDPRYGALLKKVGLGQI